MIAATWHQAKRQPLVTVAVVLVVVSSLLSAFASRMAYQAGSALGRETDRRVAQSCVTGYEVREEIRDAIETATLAGSEAIIAVADADPRQVELFRQTIAEQVAAARDEVTDPDCDLAEARRFLDDG